MLNGIVLVIVAEFGLKETKELMAEVLRTNRMIQGDLFTAGNSAICQ